MPADELAIPTPHGPARVRLRRPEGTPVAALVLGHGAGGSTDAPDLQAATRAATAAGVTVALVDQPYRVAGRRTPPAAPKLDEAWLAVVAALQIKGPSPGLQGFGGERARPLLAPGAPLLVGGRSSGARVACRTANEVGAAGVLCLAFPLHPPRRRPDAERKTRLPELEAVRAPVLVVQGERDPFGVPAAAPGREVVVLAGDHGLKKDLAGVGLTVDRWIHQVLRS